MAIHNSSKRATSTLLFIIALVALSRSAHAQEDLAALRQQLATAEALISAAERGDLAALKAGIQGFESEALPSWRGALTELRDLLKRRIDAAGQLGGLPEKATLEAQRDAARKALEALRSSQPAPLPEGEARPHLEREWLATRERTAEAVKAQQASRALEAQLTQLREETTQLTDRVALLDKQLAEPAPKEQVARYRRATASDELAWSKLRRASLPELEARVDLQLAVARAELEQAELQRQRQQTRVVELERRALRADPPATLQRERDSAGRLGALLEAGKLSEARIALGEPLAEAEKTAWLEATRERSKSLTHLIDATQQRAGAPTEAALLAKLKGLDERITALSARKPDRVEIDISDSEQISRLQVEVRNAEASEAALASALKALPAQQASEQDKIERLVAAEVAVSKRIEQGAPLATPLERYRLRALLAESLAIGEELAALRAQRTLSDKLTRVAQLELQAAQLELEYRRQLQTRASRLLADNQRRSAEATAEALRKARAEVQLTRDPIARFHKEAAVELLELRLNSEEERALRARLVVELQFQRPEPKRLAELLDRLKTQLAQGRDLSTRAVGFLLRTLNHHQRRQRALINSRLPSSRRELALRHAAQAEVAERIWQLQRTSALQLDRDEVVITDEQFEILLRKVGPSRRAEAFIAYRQAATELLPALEQRSAALTQVTKELEDLVTLQTQTAAQLEAIQSLLISQVYWIRDAAPLEGAMFSEGWSELKSARDLLIASAGQIRSGLSRHTGWLALALLMGLLALLLAWRIPARPGLPPLTPAFGAPHLERLLDGVLLAGGPALCWSAAAFAVGKLESVPPPWRGPLADVLLALSVWLAIRRLSSWAFAEGGYVEALLRTPRVMVVEMRRVLRGAAFILLLAAPWVVLQHESLGISTAPRLIYSLLLPCGLGLLCYTIRPRGALASSLAKSPLLRKSWGLAATLLSIACAVMVALDWLGYRAGSGLLVSVTLRVAVVLALLGTLRAILVRAALLSIASWSAALQASTPSAAALEDQIVKPGQPVPRAEASQAVVKAFATLRPRAPKATLPPGAIGETRDGRADPAELARFFSTLIVISGALAALWWFELIPWTRSISSGLSLPYGLSAWDLIVSASWLAVGHFALGHLPTALVAIDLMRGRARAGENRYVVATLGRYGLLILAYSGALLALKVSTTSLAWLVTALSVGIGFGLQEIVGNFISGIILLLERPVRVGDWVTIGSHTGIVRAISIRATVLENFDRQAIVLPNKALITGEVTNWTLSDRVVRRQLTVGIAYGSDISRFLETAHALLAAHPDVLTEPAPSVVFERFADSSLEFIFRFFTDVALGKVLVNELNNLLNTRLAEEQITIAFPQLDLHLTNPLDIPKP